MIYTKFVLTAVLVGVLSSCGGATDRLRCYQEVQRSYPDAVVATVPGSKYSFLVFQPSGDVVFARTLSFTSPEVTHAETVYAISPPQLITRGDEE